MGVNNWTPDQWRAYNRMTGDRHVNRRQTIAQWRILKEDLDQERALVKLERRRNVEERVEAYKRREMTHIRICRPLTFIQTGENADGD
jgi:hypothetical protein